MAHGHTSCVMLPYVLDYNMSVTGERQAEIAAAMGEPGKRASDVLDRLIRSLGMPRTLREVKVAKSDLPRLANYCMLDDWTFSNPRKITSPDHIMEILRSAW